MKKLLSVLLAIVFAFSLSTSALAAEKKEKECQPTGDGTQNKPTVICTSDQLLKAIGDSQMHYYNLGADMDLNSYGTLNISHGTYDSKWIVTGDFGGVLNGNGFTIKNFNSQTPLLSNIKTGAKVANLIMINFSIFNQGVSASTLANANSGTIENVKVSGNAGSRFGGAGLVYSNEGKIINCYFEGNTGGGSGGGGLAYINGSAGTIINSSFKGRVSGPFSAGGFVYTNLGTIQNSHTDAIVVSNGFWGTTGMQSGGFAANNSGTIKNSTATGNLYVKNMESSNFVPASKNTGKIVNSGGTGKVLNFSEYQQK